MPENVTSVTCSLAAEGTIQGAVAWADCAQLEAGETANHINLMENSDMRDMSGSPLPSPWQVESTAQGYVSAAARETAIQMPAHLTGNVMHIAGRYDRQVRVWQNIHITGSKDDRFTLGGWCSSYARKMDPLYSVYCRLQVWFGYNENDDWSLWQLGGYADFNHEEGTWQFVCGNVTAPHDYNWIRVVIYYNKQMNHADFSNLFLYREQYGTDYAYGDNRDCEAVTSISNTKDDRKYDEYHNLIRYKARGRTLATTYDWGTTETQKRKHLLQKSTSPLGTVTGYLYDAYGNTIEVKKKESESGTAKYIKETTTYNADGTYAVTQTDARGKTVTTVTDPDKGTVSSVEDPNHQTISYTYDSQRRKTKTSTTLNGKEVRTEYGYNGQTGYLSEVKQLKQNTSRTCSIVSFSRPTSSSYSSPCTSVSFNLVPSLGKSK